MTHPLPTSESVRSSLHGMRTGVRETSLGRTWNGSFPETVGSLAEVAEVDLCLARLVEGHADARRILAEAGVDPSPGVYGVWASRSVGTGVRATRSEGGWRLTGQVRFASGIDVIDRVLLPGWLDERTHLLFDVPVDEVEPDRSTWHTTAMDASRSFTVRVETEVADVTIGDENFYLGRPGFVVGGLGVAAVWAGGARSVTDQVATGLRDFSPSPHQLRRLGQMDQAAWQARALVQHVATRLDGLDLDAVEQEVAAARSAVVEACETVIDEAGRVVGPGGLSGNTRLARTLADLQLYIRQHHADLTAQTAGTRALKSAVVRP
jgi:alkylation response protein AidB-like acyl-CoA dehydrogenase